MKRIIRRGLEWLTAVLLFVIAGCVGFEKFGDDASTSNVPRIPRENLSKADLMTITDVVFIQDDLKECSDNGVWVDSLSMRLLDTCDSSWVGCSELGSGGWWIRDVCSSDMGGYRAATHLHNFELKADLSDGKETYEDRQRVYFFPIRPGQYNEYHFTVTEKITIEIEIDPSFDGEK